MWGEGGLAAGGLEGGVLMTVALRRKDGVGLGACVNAQLVQREV